MADISVPDLIRQEAQKAGVPPELALSVAEQESSFNPTAIGPKLGSGEQAVGTFQLLPSTAKRLGVDPADPTQNIRGGVQYLRELLDRHQGNLENVLKEYGGVKTDQKYVPSVLARMPKFSGAAGAQPSGPAPPPPKPQYYGRAAVGQAFGQAMRGFNPLTPEGLRNWGGMAGATAANAALTAAFPEISVPANAALWSARALRTITPIAGAYLGGGAAQGSEQVAHGQVPDPTAMMQAGSEQAKTEALGQTAGWLGRAALRRIAASNVSKSISKGLQDALDAVGYKLESTRPAVSPAEAGRMVEATAYGPAKSVKDRLGADVEATAASGPAIPTQPLKDRLAELSAQVTPMASHQGPPAQMVGGRMMSGQQVQQLMATQTARGGPPLPMLPPDHPLPATLSAVNQAIANVDEIPFEDAHKIKRALDDAVNWESPAKKQVQQITKGFRQTLREQMQAHQPYNQATEAYGDVAKLYTRPIQTLHKEILSNPEGIVKAVKWTNPSQVQMLKELTVDTASKAGQPGAQQGEAAWNALRSAWTNENLISQGPAKMATRIRQIEASNAGQEFVQTMYGDPQGKTVWNNLKQLANRLEDLQGAQKRFEATDLSRTASPAGVVRDIGYAALPGHSITKVGAFARAAFGQGASVKDMLQWAAYSDARTQFVIKHILTGPNPGMALADFARWVQQNQDVDKPVPSHVTPPPAPIALTGNRP